MTFEDHAVMLAKFDLQVYKTIELKQESAGSFKTLLTPSHNNMAVARFRSEVNDITASDGHL